MPAVPTPPGDLDEGTAWHFGNPMVEQRYLVESSAAVDHGNRGMVTVTGPDRLRWLHDLTTQDLAALSPGESALALILSPHGHVEHELHVVDDGEVAWLVCAPGSAVKLVSYLDSMKFMMRVEVEDVSDRFGVVWEPVQEVDHSTPTWLMPSDYAGLGQVWAGTDKGGGAEKYVPSRPGFMPGRQILIPRREVQQRLDQWEHDAGSWAWNALRVAAAIPRLGAETDHRTLPHEVGWVGPAVHLAKGCYRGQEAVARVHNLGHPPRRLVLLHLDGSSDELPVHGARVLSEGRDVGWVASSAQHFEEGPIATALVKRSVASESPLSVQCGESYVAAGQTQVVVG